MKLNPTPLDTDLAERFYDMTKILPEFSGQHYEWFREELLWGSLVIYRWSEDSFEAVR